MPTVFTHAAIGLGGGKIISFKRQSKKFWFFALLLPVLPDADSITFLFNIPYWHDFGHRGFFHSVSRRGSAGEEGAEPLRRRSG